MLAERFERNTGMTNVQIKSEFHEFKLTDGCKDLEVWIVKFRSFKTLGLEIADENRILHILDNLQK